MTTRNKSNTANTANTANTEAIDIELANRLQSEVTEATEATELVKWLESEATEATEVNKYKLADSYNLSTLNNLAIRLDGSDMSIHFFTYAKNNQDHYFCLVGVLELLDGKKLFSGSVYVQQDVRIATGIGFIYMKVATVTDSSVVIGNDTVKDNSRVVNLLRDNFSSMLGKLTKVEVVKAVTKASELKAKRDALTKIADAKAKLDYDAMSDTLMGLFSNN